MAKKKKLLFIFACLFGWLLPAAHLLASDESTLVGPGILFSFEGGLAGQNAATVLQILDGDGLLPTREYLLESGDSICRILDRLNYPPPCGGLESFIRYLNRDSGLKFDRLQIGAKVIVPALEFSKFTAVRRYEGNPGDDAKIGEIEFAWLHLDVTKFVVSPYAQTVTYDGYRAFVPTPSDEKSLEAIAHIGEKDIQNLAVDLIPATPPEQKVNSLADEVKDACLGGSYPQPFEYKLLSSYDENALAQIPPVQLSPVIVHLIDEPLFQFPVASDLHGKPCKWDKFDRLVHHSTHLASIIASPDIGAGFVGLAPNAAIASVEWVKRGGPDTLIPARPDRSIQLGNILYDASQLPPPVHIFVAAAQFDPSIPGIKSHLENVIKETSQLFVVAAGESEAGKPAIPISNTSTQSPQNLGNLPNVLVVTACTTCSPDNMQLMPEAFFSATEGPAIVHVVAPGGTDVPGWINHNTMGAASGTSQASAFVAGAIARMVGIYPNIYVSADRIKKRVQATSWPVATSTIASGMIDPILMDLDPTTNWIKMSGQWRPIKFRSAQSDFINFRSVDSGLDHLIRPDSILRIVQVDNNGGLAVYFDLAKAEGLPFGSVGKLYGVATDGAAKFTSCDGSPIALEDVEDILVKAGSAFGGC